MVIDNDEAGLVRIVPAIGFRREIGCAWSRVGALGKGGQVIFRQEIHTRARYGDVVRVATDKRLADKLVAGRFSVVDIIQVGKLELVFPLRISNNRVRGIGMKVTIRIGAEKVDEGRVAATMERCRIERIGGKKDTR